MLEEAKEELKQAIIDEHGEGYYYKLIGDKVKIVGYGHPWWVTKDRAEMYKGHYPTVEGRGRGVR